MSVWLTRVARRGAAAMIAMALCGAVVPQSAQAAQTVPSGGLPQGVVASAEDTLTFSGHGWGHGRGMGQFGALGYAVEHGWSAAQILDYYYGGTVAGSVGSREVTVELTAVNGRDLVVIGRDLRVNGAAVGSGDVAILARTQTDGSVLLFTSTTCAGPTWTPLAGTFHAGAVEIGTASQAGFDHLIRVCESAGERAYRGTLSVQQVGGSQMTFNRLASEDYLRGVVPRFAHIRYTGFDPYGDPVDRTFQTGLLFRDGTRKVMLRRRVQPSPQPGLSI